jgi:hypothetical protein
VITPDVAQLVAFMATAVALAILAAGLRRLGGRRDGVAAVRSSQIGRISAGSWRGSAALATAAAAGMLLAPALVALRQIYALPGVGGRMAALLLVLLILVAAAVLAVLFADPGEDR